MYHVLYIITCKVYAPPFTWCRLNLINLTFFTDYSMVLSIIDPTLHENDKKLKCLLFNREKEKLPFLDVGKIVRLHRLKVGFLFNLSNCLITQIEGWILVYLSNWLGWSFCWLPHLIYAIQLTTYSSHKLSCKVHVTFQQVIKIIRV